MARESCGRRPFRRRTNVGQRGSSVTHDTDLRRRSWTCLQTLAERNDSARLIDLRGDGPAMTKIVDKMAAYASQASVRETKKLVIDHPGTTRIYEPTRKLLFRTLRSSRDGSASATAPSLVAFIRALTSLCAVIKMIGVLHPSGLRLQLRPDIPGIRISGIRHAARLEGCCS